MVVDFRYGLSTIISCQIAALLLLLYIYTDALAQASSFLLSVILWSLFLRENIINNCMSEHSSVSGELQCSPPISAGWQFESNALFSSPKMCNQLLTIKEFTCCRQHARCFGFVFFSQHWSSCRRFCIRPWEAFPTVVFKGLVCSFQRLDVSVLSFSPTVCSPLRTSVEIEVYAIPLLTVLSVLLFVGRPKRVALQIYGR